MTILAEKRYSRLFKKYRKQSNCTQQEFADLIGVSRRTVCGVELCYYIPTGETLLKIADAFQEDIVIPFTPVKKPKLKK